MEQAGSRYRYNLRLSAGDSGHRVTVIFCARINTFPRYSYQTAAIWDEWCSNPLDSLMKRLEQRWFIYFRCYSINSQDQFLTLTSMYV